MSNFQMNMYVSKNSNYAPEKIISRIYKGMLSTLNIEESK